MQLKIMGIYRRRFGLKKNRILGRELVLALKTALKK